MKRVLVVIAALLCVAAAPDPAERLPDPAQEARARDLFKEIRCVVCQSESIDDSQAELAHDLRQVVRGQVASGKTDEQVRRFLVSRYGEYVLLRPRFTPGNLLLWATPFVIVLAGLGFVILRRRKEEPMEAPLSAEEAARLKTLVETDNG